MLGILMQLGVMGVVYGALEWCFPNRREQRHLRPRLATDLAFFFGAHLLWLSVEVAGLLAVRELLVGAVPASVPAVFADQPWLLQAAVVLVAGDLLTYWYHRASHDVPWLWRFHQVHHSTTRLDWLAAHREHPIDGFLTQLAMNLPAFALGVSLEGLAGLIIFRGAWATFIHSNVRLPIGPLRYLIGAPELHHWHHAAVRTRHNFSNLAPWTDLVFGTYHCPPHQHHELGVPGLAERGYLGWLVPPAIKADEVRSAPCEGDTSAAMNAGRSRSATSR
jgi:sterol desaturase/sphingolipid hydroxylase (fatty acid hydroxylase superfamily)